MKRLARGQYASGFSAGSDLGTHDGRGAGGPVQGNHHGLALPVVGCRNLVKCCKKARAMKSGQRFSSMKSSEM